MDKQYAHQRRIFVAGKPNRGKINDAIMKQIPGFLQLEIDKESLYNEELWESASYDDTPGYFIAVHFNIDQTPVQAVLCEDSVTMKDSAGNLQTKSKGA